MFCVHAKFSDSMDSTKMAVKIKELQETVDKLMELQEAAGGLKELQELADRARQLQRKSDIREAAAEHKLCLSGLSLLFVQFCNS